MAQLETWYKQDLKKPLVVHRHADVFNQDSRGNLIGVEIYSDGEPVTLSGSIDGYCLLADGTTVSAVGANRTGNKASILIPQTAYNVPGPITITIKNTDGNDITTFCAVVGLVRQSVSGNLVQPGDIVTDWSQSINSQLQAVQDAADNVGAIVAVPFAENTAYVVGNYVTYNGNLYRITADHAAGVTWANTAKTQRTVGTELYDLKSALSHTTDMLNTGNESIFYIWEQGTINRDSGIPQSSTSVCRVKDFFEPSKDIIVTISNPDSQAIALRKYLSDGTYDGYETITNATKFTALYGHKYKVICSSTGNPALITAKFSFPSDDSFPAVRSEESAVSLAVSSTAEFVIKDSDWERGNLTSSDGSEAINDKYIRTKCFYPVSEAGSLTISALTTNRAAFLFCYDENFAFLERTGGRLSQGTKYARFAYGFTSASSETIDSYGMQNMIDDFSVAYTSPNEITISEILNGKSGYDIYPTGDDTYRESEIAGILTDKKYCRLAPGDYYIRSMFVPQGSSLIGAGMHNTRLIYKNDGDSGKGVRLRKKAEVHDLTIEQYHAQGESFTPVNDYSQGYNGISLEGTGQDDPGEYYCVVQNVTVKNFSGCGFFQRYTGYMPSGGCSLENCYATGCSAGFYFGEYAEFSRIVNSYADFCYHGIVIMGGNVVVDACVFSENEININMPNIDGYGSSANDAHGIISDCKINHAGYYSNTTGYGFLRNGQSSAELVIGCMFGEGGILIKDTGWGTQFSGCQFRTAVGSIVADASTVIMTGCTYQSIPDIPTTVLNGGKIYRKACCGFSGTDLPDVGT